MIFALKYLCECEDTYFILQNKYLRIYEDSFGAKILRDDQCPTSTRCKQYFNKQTTVSKQRKNGAYY